MLPLSLRAFSEPPGRHPPAPGSQVSSSLAVAGGFFAPSPVQREFPQLSLLPIASLSPSRVRSVDLSHSLAFDSLSPCEVDDGLW
jgi:hypothetical protein